MGRKLTHEEAARRFQEQGCELLDTYKNNWTKVKYRCRCGRVAEITLSDFCSGRRCKKCAILTTSIKRRHSYEKVKQIFAEKGCVLLEEEYLNNKIPMRYICVCGRESKICLSSLMQGRYCLKCGADKNRKDPAIVKMRLLIKRKSGSLLRETLKATGKVKNDRKRELLGYTTQDLLQHITNHPNWERVKDTSWHLDHIFPIIAFVEHNILDLKIINHLDNLQPLTAEENMKKSWKYDIEEFKKWLKRHNINI